MTDKKYLSCYFLALILFLLPKYAYADVGMPLIIYTFPGMLIASIPIFLIEGFLYIYYLKVKTGKAFSASFVANLVSTLVGIPLSWVFMFAVEFLVMMVWSKSGVGSWGSSFSQKIAAVTLGAAWLPPLRGEASGRWMLTAVIVLLIPAFFMSVLIEYAIVKRYFKDFDKVTVKKAVINANLVTYSILIGFVAILFLI